MPRVVSVPNTELVYSLTDTVPLGKPTVSIASDGQGGSRYTATLVARRESFEGKGRSVSIALQNLATAITEAAIKRSAKGRTPDRVRIAATLLKGE